MIVCLGWGSLIWCPRTLPVVNGWNTDGPALPVEFSRQSKGERITLVIARGSDPIRVLWTRLAVHSVDEAQWALASREIGEDKEPTNEFVKNAVGFWSRSTSSNHLETPEIAGWAEAKQFDGVVWTTLKPKFNRIYRKPSCDKVVNYLSTRTGTERQKAEEYVRYAPRQIKTAYREMIERKLGWTPKTYKR